MNFQGFSCLPWGHRDAHCQVQPLHGSGELGSDLPNAHTPGTLSQPSFLSFFFGDSLSFIRVVAYRNLVTLPVATQTEENVSPQITSVYWDAF